MITLWWLWGCSCEFTSACSFMASSSFSHELNFIFYNPHESYVSDVRTQAMFQLLDTGFVGLIFSCFSEDAQKVRMLINFM